MIAEIIAAGSEMLTPFRQDTNSLYLTARLNELGVSVAFEFQRPFWQSTDSNAM